MGHDGAYAELLLPGLREGGVVPPPPPPPLHQCRCLLTGPTSPLGGTSVSPPMTLSPCPHDHEGKEGGGSGLTLPSLQGPMPPPTDYGNRETMLIVGAASPGCTWRMEGAGRLQESLTPQ